MAFDWWTFALQVVNFAILVWLLNRFLYKPVLRIVDARRADVDAQLQKATKIESDAKAQLASLEAARASIAAERDAALKAAADTADKLAAARRADAERDAQTLLDAARKTVAQERDQAFGEARKMALDLGLDVARKLFAEIPADLRAQTWLTRIETELAALSPARRGELVSGLRSGATLRVVTASPLPSDAQALWQSHLKQALGDDISMAFEIDAELIAGAELHFPAAVFKLSWRDALARIETGLDTHGDA